MKKLLIILIVAITALASCSNHHPKVQYLSGEIERVTDRFLIGDSGDTIIVEHKIFIGDSGYIYSHHHIWGIYVGTVPEEQVRYKYPSTTLRESRTWYELAIKQ